MSRYYSSILNVLSPSFANTYSLSFDGVDDFLNTGAIDLGETNTISFWFKNNSANTGNGVIGDADNHVIYFQSSNLFYYPTGSITGRKLFSSTNIASAMSDTTNWHNLILVRKAASNGLSDYNDLLCYLDGNLEGTHINIYTANINLIPLYIGKSGLISSNTYDGLIDEVSYYDNDQTANVSTISTSPVVDLTSLNPTAWWRNGDNGSYKSPQWLIPENSNVANSRISNYSFSFDGVDDVLIGPDANLASAYTKASWSFWFNASGLAITYICSRRGSNDNYGELFGINSTGKLIGNIGQSNALDGDYTGSTTISTGTWYNVVITYDGSGSTNDDKVKVYLNGSLETLSWIGTVQTELLQSVGAGRKYAIGKAFNGKVDEVAIWYDTTLTPANAITIYNSGIPADLSSLSPNFINIRMGENATFSTNWNVPDTVNSPTNDFTSANMTIEDRVGEAPNSNNNALSYNMTESDRETDVPS